MAAFSFGKRLRFLLTVLTRPQSPSLLVLVADAYTWLKQKSLRWSSFIELSLRVKSQKSHSESQAVKTEVEDTIFAIAAMFV